jgi:hypothetical protein
MGLALQVLMGPSIDGPGNPLADEHPQPEPRRFFQWFDLIAFSEVEKSP